jgi:hypothetical protein
LVWRVPGTSKNRIRLRTTAAQRKPELVLIEHRLRLAVPVGEKVGGVERSVAEEFEDRP